VSSEEESEEDTLLISDDLQTISKGSKMKRKTSAISIDLVSIFH
jgi:hypothetical protein